MLMKKVTLLLVAALMAVISYANSERPVRTLARHSAMINALHRSVTNRVAIGTQPQAVALPAGVTAKEYTLSYADYDGNPAYGVVHIAFDGNDVYMNGISSYLPEAYIQGKLSGSTITFAGSQSLGTYSDYEVFMQEEDAVFSYDASSGILAYSGLFYTYIDQYYDGYFVNPVMMPVVEKAATPANPFIRSISNTDYGYVMSFSIPTVDTQGDGLVSSKLSYQFFYQVGDEVYPLTFKAADYKYLEEDLTVIPYGFTENYDIYTDQIYLNMDFSSWTAVGVQSTYTGGGESRQSEVVWFQMESGGGDTPGTTIDWVASEQGYDNGQEVPSISISSTITGTLSQASGSIAPKYYTSGTSLRMYAGNTLTLTSTDPMTQITFTFDTNNGVKMPAFDVSTGTITFDGAKAVWIGNATEITFSVPNITGQQSRIQQISVGISSGGGTDPDPVPDLVTPPSTANIENWYLDAVGYDNDVYAVLPIAIDGNDMYIQGLFPGYLPDAWIKGTIDGNKVTFPTGQYVGNLSSEEASYQCYILGYDETTESLCDIVFSYDADNGVLATNHYIILNSGTASLSAIDYVSYVDITKTAPVYPEPIQAPAGLVTSEYVMSGYEYVTDESSETEISLSPIDARVLIGFDGSDVYFYGLADTLWAKGTLSSDGTKITIPANQYMGTIENYFYTSDYYVTALDSVTGQMVDLVFNYDAANGILSSNQEVCLNGSRKILYYYSICVDVKLTKMVEFAATPATPAVAGFSYNETAAWGRLQAVIPLVDVDGKDLLTSCLSYQVMIEYRDGTVAPLTFTTDLYHDLTSDMDTIPYALRNYDFYPGEKHSIYLNQPLEVMKTWKQIGIKSIYTGGGETHESAVSWYSLEEWYESLGIADVKAEPLSTTYYNLQGRPVSASQKGLLIQQTRMADGTVKTRKVVRR